MDEQMTFTEFCGKIGMEPEFFMDQMKIFTEAMEENGWSNFPPNAKEKMEELINLAYFDLPMPPAIIQIASALAMFSNAVNESGDEVMIEGIDEFPIQVQGMIGLATTVAQAACSNKAAACGENNGPASLPGLIFYMTSNKNIAEDLDDLNDIDMDDYDVHSIEAYIDHSADDPMSDIREKLGDAFAMFGPPIVLGLACDTYVREFENAEDAYKAGRAVEKLEEDYLTQPETDVIRAMCTIVQVHNQPVVTTTNEYRYDDMGMPIFVECKYSVNELSELLPDLSDRGRICDVFNQFLALRV